MVPSLFLYYFIYSEILVSLKNDGFSFSQFYFVFQACHLLCFLSKELLGDFEACAEMFIPVSERSCKTVVIMLGILICFCCLLCFQVLFKLVVITVLVIAESADNCIKTVLLFLY